LVAVAIISVVGLALLSMKSNHSYLFAKSYEKLEANSILSVFSLGDSGKITDGSANLKDTTAIFNIQDDDILTFLKSKEFDYKNSESSIIDFAEIQDDEQSSNQSSSQSSRQGDEATFENTFIFQLEQQGIATKEGGSFIYRIQLGE